MVLYGFQFFLGGIIAAVTVIVLTLVSAALISLIRSAYAQYRHIRDWGWADFHEVGYWRIVKRWPHLREPSHRAQTR